MPLHQTAPSTHERPPTAVPGPCRRCYLFRPLTCQRGMQDHPTGERRRQRQPGKGGTRARASRVWCTHAHTNTLIHSILFHSVPFLLLLLRAKCHCVRHFKRSRRLFGQRQPKPSSVTANQTAGIGSRQGWGRDVVGTGARATCGHFFFSLAAAASGAFTAHGEPTVALASGVPRQFFVGSEMAPLMSGSGVSQRPPFFFSCSRGLVFGLVWFGSVETKRHAAIRLRQGGDLPLFFCTV
ncbi:hypothetical protein B0T18DRAFT_46436 [Schizothecium vesticola]|uniref:Uncharacterized protein n=1 Tax=Schizothecium vesticola TaxID=314040 RepID=A0AA40FBS7_9PEZI|nr:hypothetical protein B0T18DRAFT_46436 [Schizothecium vesticola]